MRDGKNNLNVLVLGMGTYVFGREKRAVSAFTHMSRIRPYFLIPQWEDGSVSRLLRENRLEFGRAPFGYLGRARPLWTLDTLLHLPRLYFEVLRAYWKQRCKAIVFLSFHPFISAFPPIIFLRFFCRARLVFYLGDIPTNNLFNHGVAAWADRLSSRFVANSLAVKKGMTAMSIPESKIQVVYNGIDLLQFQQAEAKDLKKQFGWTHETSLVGYLGQINEKKGITDFVEAAAEVIKKDSNCRFLIFGRTPLKGNGLPEEIIESIRARHLENHVVFSGWEEGVATVYKALDVVVVPSRYEDPAPHVNIEAMAAGVPVVATQAGGSPELVEDGVTGFLVAKQDVKSIAARVLELVQYPSLRGKMGRAAKNRVRCLFDIQKNAAQLEKILFHV